MNWNSIEQYISKARLYATSFGQIWWIIIAMFRLIVIVAVASSVYGDEQGAFKCDTLQPGCSSVCFNRFSPMHYGTKRRKNGGNEPK